MSSPPGDLRFWSATCIPPLTFLYTRPRIGSFGRGSVSASKFWGFLNLSLRFAIIVNNCLFLIIQIYPIHSLKPCLAHFLGFSAFWCIFSPLLSFFLFGFIFTDWPPAQGGGGLYLKVPQSSNCGLPFSAASVCLQCEI